MNPHLSLEKLGSSVDPKALQEELAAKGVRYCLASYVDLHGVTKAKIVPLQHIGGMLAGSELFTGAALDGVPQDVSDDEVATVPDASQYIVCPWDKKFAWFPSNLYLHDQPFEACSRNIAKRVAERALNMGFTCNLGIEPEFYVFKDGTEDNPQVLSAQDKLDKPCYDIGTALDNFGWLDEVVTSLNDLGWEVNSFDHEDGIGQFELDFGYTDMIGMADRLTFLRLLLRETLKPHGLFPSFMPKPFADRTGSGHHLNMSMSDLEGNNIFYDAKDPRGCGLSTVGYHFIAGILKHAPAICAVIAPTVNSYKRLVKQGSMSGSTWAPVFACYGDNNRTNMVRIPMGGKRVECRAADSALNPYLSAALIFAAGLEGIEQELDPGEPNHENMYHLSQAELDKRGITHLPESLGAALDAFAEDELAKATFGEAMHQSFLDYKRDEWYAYSNHVERLGT